MNPRDKRFLEVYITFTVALIFAFWIWLNEALTLFHKLLLTMMIDLDVLLRSIIMSLTDIEKKKEVK